MKVEIEETSGERRFQVTVNGGEYLAILSYDYNAGYTDITVYDENGDILEGNDIYDRIIKEIETYV